MTSTRRLLALASAVALAASLSACASAAPTASPTPTSTGPAAAACAGDEGVTLVVDASALDDAASSAWCVIADEEIAVADALATTGITTEGTDEYGDQVVCRVDGLPAADEALPNPDGSDYFETCASMPAAFAYWSVWVKPAGGEWDYAQEGLSTLTAAPGDSVELLFTLNGEPAAPAPTS